jgi:UDP-N-acetylmuramoylalanine--D-glutamate ligase
VNSLSFINAKLNKFKEEIVGKKVAVLGVGISNIPAIEYLVSLGANVEARDKKEKLDSNCDKLKSLDIDYVLGEKYLENLDNFDYILRSPGIKPFLPELEKAEKNGVRITSEIELLIDLCPAKVIGVTGSDGKTTTTTLISKFLEEAGYNVWLGGNIGKPLFSKLDLMTDKDIVVLELSSFQLMTMNQSPNISVITNISPNHLDYHRSFDEYVDSKANVFLHQEKDGIVVLNSDNSYTNDYLKKIYDRKIGNSVRYFSVIDNIKPGVFLKNGYIFSNVDNKEEVIAPITDVKLVGIHNLANICAASSAVIQLTGIEPIKKVITTFKGVEHRMELVRQENGVKWYNDSIGTSPARTIAGLISFNQKVILIAGGYDKNIPYDEIGKYIIDKVKTLILIGKTGPKIKKAVLDEANKQKLEINLICNIIYKQTLEECVEYAKSVSSDGDIVVLSPASASFDTYKNFEERGDHFKKLVNEL